MTEQMDVPERIKASKVVASTLVHTLVDLKVKTNSDAIDILSHACMSLLWCAANKGLEQQDCSAFLLTCTELLTELVEHGEEINK